MKKKDVIRRLCKLSSKVGEEVFGHLKPTDCFCEISSLEKGNFQFSEEVVIFIENAVITAILDRTTLRLKKEERMDKHCPICKNELVFCTCNKQVNKLLRNILSSFRQGLLTQDETIERIVREVGYEVPVRGRDDSKNRSVLQGVQRNEEGEY